MQDLSAQVQKQMQTHALPQALDQIVVGFSGGPDSTALLLILSSLDLPVSAVHLNHQLRAEAEVDQDWCRDFCLARGIPFHAADLDVRGRRHQAESVEMAGRRLRLEYWQHHCRGPGVVVALAHHLDDRLENFFIRFCRGGNCSGLSALRSRVVIGGVCLLRPLLQIRRHEIMTYLAEQGVTDCRQDASNHDPQYKRNRIRHELLPILQDIAGVDIGLFRSLDYLEQDALYLETCANEVITDKPEALELSSLKQLDFCLWPRLLKRWLHDTHNIRPNLTRGCLETLYRTLHAQDNGVRRVEIDRGYQFSLEQGRLRLELVAAPGVAPERNWNWQSEAEIRIPEAGVILTAQPVSRAHVAFDDPAAEYWDADVLPDELRVRGRYDGDRMLPFGASAPVRLKKLIAASKLTSSQKQRLVLVLDEDLIIWVPMVRRSASAPVTEQSKHIIRLCCREFEIK